MNADGTNPQRLTVNRSADDAFPDWSPDGTKIAFESDRDGKYEIYVMNADGSGQTNLTREPQTDDEAPAWSPDGTRIAFHSEGDIYAMNADGTGQTRLTRGNQVDVFPDWSPDGTHIIFVGGGETTGYIDEINPDGSGRHRLTKGGSEYFPEWSPDGTRIAFVSAAGGTGDVFVMNADGSGRSNLTRAIKREDFEPSWSPDGTKIAYTSVLDKTAPTVLVAIPSRQRAARQKGVQVVMLCSETCRYRVTGQIGVRGGPRVVLKPAAGKISGFGIKRLKLRLSGAQAKKLAAQLGRGKKASAKIVVQATDPAGNTAVARRRAAVR
jgi:Tol biopolymer transport system component